MYIKLKTRSWLLKTSLFLSFIIFVHAEAQERMQRLQQKAEVNNGNKVETVKKFKFGDRKPTTARRSDFVNFRPEDSIAPQFPVQINHGQQNEKISTIMQYEIPIVQKTSNLYKGQQQTSASSPTTSSSSSSSSSSTTTTTEKRLNAIVTPRNWSHSRDGISNAFVGQQQQQQQQQQRKQYISSSLQRSSGIVTGKPQLKKSATSNKTTTTTITTTTTTATTSRPTVPSYIPSSNQFNIFSPEFWGFSNPTQATILTTKRPPKKYAPTVATTLLPKEEKLSLQKVKTSPKTKPTQKSTTTTSATTTTTTTTTTTKKQNDDGPFRIALPTFNFFNTDAQNQSEDPVKEKEKRASIASLREKFNCPRESEVRFQLFPKICKNDRDCSVWNRDELCCEIFGAKSCVNGIAKPLEESSHAPILGLIQRKCPTRPLAELWWEVKECQTDMDCWPRVCCPDGQRRYCRTSQPELQTAPVPVKRSFDYLTEYLECTPPPPPIFDLHPKACTSTFDCFPNVCCQEAGLRHCRPPKKSVLTLMANFLNVDLVKRFTQNIVIK